MVVMNHFAAAGGPRAAIEAAMEKVAWWLGWHPKFPFTAVGDWIAAQPDAELIERRESAPAAAFHLAGDRQARRGALTSTGGASPLRL